MTRGALGARFNKWPRHVKQSFIHLSFNIQINSGPIGSQFNITSVDADKGVYLCEAILYDIHPRGGIFSALYSLKSVTWSRYHSIWKIEAFHNMRLRQPSDVGSIKRRIRRKRSRIFL